MEDILVVDILEEGILEEGTLEEDRRLWGTLPVGTLIPITNSR